MYNNKTTNICFKILKYAIVSFTLDIHNNDPGLFTYDATLYFVATLRSMAFMCDLYSALAEKLTQSSETNDEKLKLLKEAIINCRQNEAYLRIINVRYSIFFCLSLQETAL